eukprot:CAMPEP_0174386826 /NCGR_PEP_ID=MMETSP0811_2-20130205/127543_1 /TAXON_ID=73025 ORGANISM="Eutreptiella gymnastica-like, Strain CCMP1594" /NCGR_SAMPLE_ID=MMETSP0811_2 /ASSEMBLY_ACC=CAM_ASM_000667 /LENGTH=110 /DNA_ID=CAMNT_0015541641 /DNA_START=1682 /DNA_END=2011 /DNA_ORIENTATION=+
MPETRSIGVPNGPLASWQHPAPEIYESRVYLWLQKTSAGSWNDRRTPRQESGHGSTHATVGSKEEGHGLVSAPTVYWRSAESYRQGCVRLHLVGLARIGGGGSSHIARID